ncbi:MAG: tRNA uridine-5-carboxymethylaminomethyl(34) synthesis GTPase MnmE [Deltaproteobacteria bacterium]|nr:tRNA uridine-5-carboxymethylaminomethyl(34) synthesis GTPase MnmE [Deltaproteobacteria bacterium]MBW2219923.1 tRNA uridine-5-carboxymethylaminomethyl(34) synthesis GTPase MnmE [Deltaproteobacteria bacterium]
MPKTDMSNTTIAAIATTFGNSGIGIVRISGPDAFRIGKTVFRKGKRKSGGTPEKKTHVLQYGYIIDKDTEETLDEVLVAFMKAPYTYTKEDIVEIHAHSGQFVLRSILALVLKSGAKIAQPGEFTKRAFLNGRIDLTRAEAVVDIINAGSKASLKIAASKIQGLLKEKIEEARERLLDLRAGLEANIDFPEESGDTVNKRQDINNIETRVIKPLKRIVESFDRSSYLVEGLKIVIVGEPNVGKSSLLNQILQKDKAIVTPVPGTTRDLVEEHINIKGLPVLVSDTAGIHTTEDPVERVGIQKAKQRIETADIVLLVVEACREVTENEKNVYNKIREKEVVIAINKQDLVCGESKFTMPKEWQQRKSVYMSALNGTGIDLLVKTIENVCLANADKANDDIVPNLRQKRLLESSVESAESAAEALRKDVLPEITVVDMADSIDALDEILGKKAETDYLDRIFENFCIGK